jgi:enamine deaminase RidA (YjgF/YER057c/UK114 family)
MEPFCINKYPAGAPIVNATFLTENALSSEHQQEDLMASPIKRHHPGGSLSRLVEFGALVFVSGTTADNTSASCKVQTEEVLKKIDRYLAEAGSDKSKILWCNVWLTDIREKDQMDAAWQAWVDPDNKPARATVESRLGTPDIRVEIMMICAK